MKKIYFASGISDKPRKQYQSEVAKRIEALGFEVYAAANNDSINDKSNDPTPMDIYIGDIHEIQKADIVVVCISGGNEDGTISEIGMTTGWNAAVDIAQKAHGVWEDDNLLNIKPIIMYTTNERLAKPQFWQGNVIKDKLKRGESVSDAEYVERYEGLYALAKKLPATEAVEATKILNSINVTRGSMADEDRTAIMLVEAALAQDGLASAGFNHLVAGMVDRWGTFAGDEAGMMEVLKTMK